MSASVAVFNQFDMLNISIDKDLVLYVFYNPIWKYASNQTEPREKKYRCTKYIYNWK